MCYPLFVEQVAHLQLNVGERVNAVPCRCRHFKMKITQPLVATLAL